MVLLLMLHWRSTLRSPRTGGGSFLVAAGGLANSVRTCDCGYARMGRGRDCATGRGGVDALPLPLVWFCPRVIRVRIRKQGKGSAAAATGGARQGTPVRQQGDAPRLPPEGAVPGPAVGGGEGQRQRRGRPLPLVECCQHEDIPPISARS